MSATLVSDTRGVSTHSRKPLVANWQLCATPANEVQIPDQLPDPTAPAWLRIDGPDTVAGALRRTGHWSLDAPPKRFDADDWWFRAVFMVPAVSGAARRALGFGGIAGECRLWLNRQPLLVSDNMHIAHTCDVMSFKDGENELLMRFASLDARLAIRQPRPRWRAPMVQHAQLRRVRVGLLGRTPGWSPPAPAIGPWRAVEWVEINRIDVSGLRLDTEVCDRRGKVTLAVVLEPIGDGGIVEGATLRVRRGDERYEVEVPRADGCGSRFATTLLISEVTLWWPHTHGDPALYHAELLVELAGTPDAITVDLGQLGFRTLKVDVADGDFAVHINGVAVFCRGAVWTPLDVVSAAAARDATRAALAQVRAAGMNMLRVSGSMVYEDESFYAACDDLGILIWQDFMFANMDYSDNEEVFFASVRTEARQQLARWQGHPSLAVICGNSEAEQQAAMSGSPRETWGQALFDQELAGLAQEFCPGVTYWPSSAHGGAIPHQNDVGTTSYYGVGAYLRPLQDARRANVRFASECLAFANVPPPATVARMPGGASLRTHHPGWKARTPRDLNAGWDFEDVRDHYLEQLYRVDATALRSTDHERYMDLSRTVSAEVIEATFNEWRRPGSTCRGGLIWFLRDLWAGAGWGLLDDRGVPKAAFHGMRRASAPVHLFLTDEGTNGLALHVVNDPATALAASVEINFYREDGLRLQSASRDVATPAHSGQSWAVGEWFDSFIDTTRAYRFGPPEYALIAATMRDAEGHVLDRAFFWPEGLSAVRRRDIGLNIRRIEGHASGEVVVSISTTAPAQSVYFEAEGYVAEEEYFHLAPGDDRVVALTPSQDCANPAQQIGVLAINGWSRAICEVGRP